MSSLLMMVLCCSVLTVPALQAAESVTKPTDDKPVIMIREPEFRFEPVIEGTIVEHEYKIVNAGGAPLIIERIQTGCGCTTADFTKSIPPGGEGHVVIKGNTEGYGGQSFSRDITIFCNDPSNPTPELAINGNVQRFAGIEPKRVTFNNTSKTMRVTITPVPDFPFQIVESFADKDLEPKITFTLRKEKEGYELTVFNQAKGPVTYSGKIHLRTDSKVKPELTIPVTAMLTAEAS